MPGDVEGDVESKEDKSTECCWPTTPEITHGIDQNNPISATKPPSPPPLPPPLQKLEKLKEGKFTPKIVKPRVSLDTKKPKTVQREPLHKVKQDKVSIFNNTVNKKLISESAETKKTKIETKETKETKDTKETDTIHTKEEREESDKKWESYVNRTKSRLYKQAYRSIHGYSMGALTLDDLTKLYKKFNLTFSDADIKCVLQMISKNKTSINATYDEFTAKFEEELQRDNGNDTFNSTFELCAGDTSAFDNDFVTHNTSISKEDATISLPSLNSVLLHLGITANGMDAQSMLDVAQDRNTFMRIMKTGNNDLYN